MQENTYTGRRRVRMVRRRRKKEHRTFIVLVIMLISLILFLSYEIRQAFQYLPATEYAGVLHSADNLNRNNSLSAENRIEQIRLTAQEKNIPQNVIDLLDKNPETAEFVEKYNPGKLLPVSNIQTELKSGEYPQFIQWDTDWGYQTYGSGVIGTSGCGPTSLAIVIAGLTQNEEVNPSVIASYAESQNALDANNNTYWSFIRDGGQNWGVYGKEGMLNKVQLKNTLQEGTPVICSMKPGDFTTTGHFIVLTKMENGKIKVNDPFSKKNSEKLWNASRIISQSKNMWTYSLLQNY